MGPQSDLKATQMDMGGPLQTYGIYCADATMGLLGRSWKSIIFLLVVMAPTFFFPLFFCYFYRLWGQNGAQKGWVFTPGLPPKLHFLLTRRPKVATVGSRRGLRSKNDSQMVPQGAKRGSQ